MKRAACVLVRREDGKILGISRKNDHNSYGLVGGGVEDGESCSDAAIREFKEETGGTIKNLKFLYARECPSEEVTYWSACYSAELASEVSDQPGEGKLKWVTPEILIKGPFGIYNKDLFNHIGIEYNVREND